MHYFNCIARMNFRSILLALFVSFGLFASNVGEPNIESEQSVLFNNGDEDVDTLLGLRNSVQSIQDSFNGLKDWFGSQPHLAHITLDDDRLLKNVLLATKSNLTKSETILDNYFSARSKFPQLFQNRNPFDDDVLKASEYVEFAIVPRLTPDKNRVVVAKYTDKDPSKFDPVALFKLIFMMAETRVRYDTATGDLYVWDLTHFTPEHLQKFSPKLIEDSLFISQNCFMSRVKAIYVLNAPKSAKSALDNIEASLQKPGSASKIIHEVSSLEELRKYVDSKSLPVEMGGVENTTREMEDAVLKVLQTNKWNSFLRDSGNIRSLETKRPATLRQNDDRFAPLTRVELD